MVVGKVVDCGNMFMGEHEASIEDADGEVCRVGGTWIVEYPHREAGLYLRKEAIHYRVHITATLPSSGICSKLQIIGVALINL